MARRQPYMPPGQQGPASPATAAGAAPNMGGAPMGPQPGRMPPRPPMTGAQNPQALPTPPPPADPMGGGPMSPMNVGPSGMLTSKAQLSPGMAPQGQPASPGAGAGAAPGAGPMAMPLGGGLPQPAAMVPATQGGVPQYSSAIMLKTLKAMGAI